MTLPAPTAEELEELLDALFPAEFLRRLREEGEGLGYDLYAAAAAILARVSSAVDVTTQAYYLRHHAEQTQPPAGAEARATVDVTIRRAQDASFDLTLIAGTEFGSTVRTPEGSTVEGPRFRLPADLTIPAGVSSGAATLEAVRPGYQGNVPAGAIVRAAEVRAADVPSVDVTGAVGASVLEGDGTPDRFTRELRGRYLDFRAGANTGALPRRIVDAGPDRVVVDGGALVSETGAAVHVYSWAELGIEVEQPDAATGGRHGWLDAIGEERGIWRRLGEGDDEYRERIGRLADTISPAAIERTVELALNAMAAPPAWELRETRDPATWPGFRLDVDPLDVLDAFGGYVGGCEITTAFVVAVGPSSEGEFGAPYDATGALPVPNALDVFPLDGYPVDYYAALAALYDAIEAARAAGVCWSLVLDPSL